VIVEILVSGIVISAIYALLASGFALIFGVARIINLGHTAFYMLAAYFLFTFANLLGLNVFLSAILSIVIVVLMGIGVYELLIDPIREHETTVLLTTIALAILIQSCMLEAFGGQYRGVSSFFFGSVELLGVSVSYQQLLTIGLALVVLFSLWLFLSKSKLGVAIRATAQDREVANLMGIDVGRICLTTMAVAVGLAAISGVIVAALFVAGPTMWMEPLIIVVAIVVLGGLGSVRGSFVGALIMGFVETMVVAFLPMGSFLKGAIALAVMVVVLLIKPEGMFGVVFEEERL